MALDIKPTRSELIKLKGRIKQTKNGYKLLKMKRDGLFHEFRTLLSEMIEAKRDLTDAYRLAKTRIDLANAIEGGLAVRAAAIANSAHPEVEVERRNIMGVVVPSVSGTNLKSTFAERGIGFIGSSPYIDEASDSFSELIEKIVTASEMEATLKRLLAEIEATKRRVNALEFKVIPELEEAKVFIQLRLEEMEREENLPFEAFQEQVSPRLPTRDSWRMGRTATTRGLNRGRTNTGCRDRTASSQEGLDSTRSPCLHPQRLRRRPAKKRWTMAFMADCSILRQRPRRCGSSQFPS